MYDSKSVGESLIISQASYELKIEEIESSLKKLRNEELNKDERETELNLIKEQLKENNLEDYTVVGASDVGGMQAIALKDREGNITIGYRGTNSLFGYDGNTNTRLTLGTLP